MLIPINFVLKNRIKKSDFKEFNIQEKCGECEKSIFDEMGMDSNNWNIKVLNIKKDILTVLCDNKIISNEIQLRKKSIIEKIKRDKKINIGDIRVV